MTKKYYLFGMPIVLVKMHIWDKKGIQGGSGISSDGALFPSPNMVKAVNMKVNRGFEQWIGPEQDKYYAKTQ